MHSAVFHLLGGAVIGLHAHALCFHIGSPFHLGMCELVPSLEYRGFAEDDKLLTDLIVLVDILRPMKPHQVDHSAPVGEVSHDAFLALAHGKFLETHDLSAYLHERHVAPQFADGIDLRTVHIFIWIVFQQVTPCPDVELRTQQLFFLRAYAREIHDVLVENGIHKT